MRSSCSDAISYRPCGVQKKLSIIGWSRFKPLDSGSQSLRKVGDKMWRPENWKRSEWNGAVVSSIVHDGNGADMAVWALWGEE